MDRTLWGIDMGYWGLALVILALLVIQNLALRMCRSRIYKTCLYCNLDNPKKASVCGNCGKEYPPSGP